MSVSVPEQQRGRSGLSVPCEALGCGGGGCGIWQAHGREAAAGSRPARQPPPAGRLSPPAGRLSPRRDRGSQEREAGAVEDMGLLMGC